MATMRQILGGIVGMDAYAVLVDNAGQEYEARDLLANAGGVNMDDAEHAAWLETEYAWYEGVDGRDRIYPVQPKGNYANSNGEPEWIIKW